MAVDLLPCPSLRNEVNSFSTLGPKGEKREEELDSGSCGFGQTRGGGRRSNNRSSTRVPCKIKRRKVETRLSIKVDLCNGREERQGRSCGVHDRWKRGWSLGRRGREKRRGWAETMASVLRKEGTARANEAAMPVHMRKNSRNPVVRSSRSRVETRTKYNRMDGFLLWCLYRQ